MTKYSAKKTEILHIEPKRSIPTYKSKYEDLKKPSIQILGQIFGKNQVKDTWTKRIMKIQKTLNAYRHRRLTWVGKKTILNSIASTQIIYNARVISMPKEEQKQIQKLYFNFLWHPGKMEAIRRKTLLAEKDRGGFGMPDVEARIKTCELEKILVLKKSSHWPRKS